jgi:transcriptional regulator with XRE-family HTH domain
MVTRIGPRVPRRNHIKDWREKRGLTQEQLAERLGTYKAQISNWENARRSLTFAVQSALAEALDIEPSDIFRSPERPSADELLRDVPPDVHRQAIELIRVLVNKKAS